MFSILDKHLTGHEKKTTHLIFRKSWFYWKQSFEDMLTVSDQHNSFIKLYHVNLCLEKKMSVLLNYQQYLVKESGEPCVLQFCNVSGSCLLKLNEENSLHITFEYICYDSYEVRNKMSRDQLRTVWTKASSVWYTGQNGHTS